MQAAKLYRLLMLHIKATDRQPVWSQLYDVICADALRWSMSATASKPRDDS